MGMPKHSGTNVEALTRETASESPLRQKDRYRSQVLRAAVAGCLRATSRPLSDSSACSSANRPSPLRPSSNSNRGFQYICRPAMPQPFV